MMKSVLLTLAVAAAVCHAVPSKPLEESPRFAFSLGSGDGAFLSFNQTSLAQGLFFLVVALVFAFVAVPLLGLDLSAIFNKEEDTYAPYGYAQDAHQAYASPYAQRSLDILSPVISALAAAYQEIPVNKVLCHNDDLRLNTSVLKILMCY
ncbi:uncharacterized protein LOC119587684 [Penaeus monodon]|uniref:uncharacterized protein LOC119587684 n=1 Tax=Penaeus monodon TaxID=6687 RepID=UPI0018A7BE8C|nr:uncharacterized protein LOC119587684 [Penaeus monodon]